MKTTFSYDHYYKYAEMQSNLQYFAEKYSNLCTLDVNMVTPEGPSQYVVTLTNKDTGDALSKPGWYLDGNIHAGEVTSSMCAMHTIDTLLTNYETDASMHRILDTMTIYVIPRVSPDGAEKYLTSPYNLRSVDRAYLPEKGGIKPEDLDGDGVIRMMLIPSAYGAWKKDPSSAAGVVLRSPSDAVGEFYDLYPEGNLEEPAGDNLKQKKPDWGLDFNRNFPFGWFPDARQGGAGKYPLSNPECKAIVDFVLAHDNIGGAAIGHTSGGLVLIPPGTKPEKNAPKQDMKAMHAIADMGKEELGYVPMNIFDSFMDDQVNYDSGALDDWFYQAQGIPAYTMEFWDVSTKAGVPMNWGSRKDEGEEKRLERFVAIMKWVKENAPQYYKDWQPFDHPAFGKVEIGGFNTKFTIQNPPEKFLLTECEHDTNFNLRFVQAMPHLAIDSFTAEKKAEGVYEVSAVIGNHGYLPTNLTENALLMKTAKPVEAKLDGAEILGAESTVDLGHLEGYANTNTSSVYGNLTTFASGKARKKAVWIVRGEPGTKLTLTVSSCKAGSVHDSIVL